MSEINAEELAELTRKYAQLAERIERFHNLEYSVKWQAGNARRAEAESMIFRKLVLTVFDNHGVIPNDWWQQAKQSLSGGSVTKLSEEIKALRELSGSIHCFLNENDGGAGCMGLRSDLDKHRATKGELPLTNAECRNCDTCSYWGAAGDAPHAPITCHKCNDKGGWLEHVQYGEHGFWHPGEWQKCECQKENRVEAKENTESKTS